MLVPKWITKCPIPASWNLNQHKTPDTFWNEKRNSHFQAVLNYLINRSSEIAESPNNYFSLIWDCVFVLTGEELFSWCPKNFIPLML